MKDKSVCVDSWTFITVRTANIIISDARTVVQAVVIEAKVSSMYGKKWMEIR